MKRTAFHDVNLDNGAVMREMFGYLLPWEYAPGHAAEHMATRRSASICDLDYMGEYTIEGPDALAFVQRVFTNDFRTLTVGAIRYTAMCDQDGGMVDDGTVWRMADDKFMFVSGDEADYDWLVANSSGFDVRLANITSELTTLAIQGPRARDVIASVTTQDLGALRYYHFVRTTIAGVDCLLDAMGYTGEAGYEVHVHPRHARQVWTALMSAGEAVGMLPLGQCALESLRQEAGYLLVGNDHDRNTNPLEAGIGWVVRFGKGDFIGRQALFDRARGGVQRRLVWFRLKSGAVPAKGDTILSGSTKIGEVTSGSFSPTFGDATAMGYVQPGFAVPGIDYTIVVGGEPQVATLSVMPRYDPGDWLTKPRS
jgi:aminomethyltransferase